MRRQGSHFSNLRIRSGIFYFLCLVALLHTGRRMLPELLYPNAPRLIRTDSLGQALWDSLLPEGPKGQKPALTPRDPNYLGDFEGYRLGLSPANLDSLYAFRERGGRIRSLEEFGKVTGMEDTALHRLRTLLRFKPVKRPARSIPIRDLNTATAAELSQVRGIGPVLSARILRFREALGGFRDASQLYDVYGLEPEVAERAIRSFMVKRPASARQLPVNSASAAELVALPYISRQMADSLVARRERSGPIRELGELALLWELPQNKVERIALYLTLETE